MREIIFLKVLMLIRQVPQKSVLFYDIICDAVIYYIMSFKQLPEFGLMMG